MSEDSTKYHVSDGRALTPAEIARLDEIEARLGDDEDISEITDAAWATAQRGKHAKPKQEAISLQLDADVLAWLRGKGPGYRAEISRILRERMLQEA
jgi:uncharacterized protein (DUF4415 family)